MVDSEIIKEIVHQAAVQAATVVMMLFTGTDTEPWLATTPNQYEN